MKTVRFILLSCIAIIVASTWSGCVTVDPSAAKRADDPAARIRRITAITASSALVYNPELRHEIAEVDRRVGFLLSAEDIVITPEMIEQGIADIVARNSHDPERARLLTQLAFTVYREFLGEFPTVTVVRTSDSRVRDYLQAFHAGVRQVVSPYL